MITSVIVKTNWRKYDKKGKGVMCDKLDNEKKNI